MRFKITPGIQDHQIDQLINYAHTDTAVVNFTTDPKRFKNRDAYNQWFKQGKIIYTLINQANDLLGIIWFSKNKRGLTFAIRIYGLARGKHYAQKFMTQAFKTLIESYPEYAKEKIWLETSSTNLPAITVYNHFGFRQQAMPNRPGKLTMVFDLERLDGS